MQVVTLIHEENGAYGASFPDFPGCTTVADNAEQAIAKAAEVLAFHVEGMAEDGLPFPAIRSIEELRRDPVFCQDADGALITRITLTSPSRAVRSTGTAS